MNNLEGKKVGFAMCGSFCTFSRCFEVLDRLIELGCDIIPIMSENAYNTDTRFGKATEHIERIKEKTGKEIIHTIVDAEPIGPKKLTDIMLIVNCTGNTMAKLSASITDSAVTMAVKSHLRNKKPVLINLATNDALSGSAKNIFSLMNYKNYYFVPVYQDDYSLKPFSLMGDFKLIPKALEEALEGRQLQPIIDPTNIIYQE